MSAPACEVTERFATESFPCGEPATTKASKPPHWYLCQEHTMYALIAGWDPAPLVATDSEGGAGTDRGET